VVKNIFKVFKNKFGRKKKALTFATPTKKCGKLIKRFE